MRSIALKNTVRRHTICCFALGILLPVVSIATHGETHILDEHRIVFPQIRPDSNSECATEAAAYAASIVNLNDARRAAEEAYRRWYECEYQGKDVKPVVLAPLPEFSVLIRD